jgi:spore germination protein KA
VVEGTQETAFREKWGEVLNRFKSLGRIKRINKEKEEMTAPKEGEDCLDHYELEELKEELSCQFGNTSDLKIEELKAGGTDALLFYIQTMVDANVLKETIHNITAESSTDIRVKTIDDVKQMGKDYFGGSGYEMVETPAEMIETMLDGSIVLAFKDVSRAISIPVPTSDSRSVNEPSTQTVVRGPKDGFVENISVNVSLVRRRLKNSKLQFEEFTIGIDTNTTVIVCYMRDIADDGIVEEVRKRLKKINASAIFESGNIEELIADKTATLFPLALNTERPDAVAANMLEGKVAILVDGSPFVLVVPAVLVDFFSVSEDYYQHFMMGTFIRFIRYISFMIALLTPSLYVGILTFHHELLPTTLLLSVIAQREGVPFPAVIEVLLMEITFEILREAGVRMPRAVGQTVSIVGALVIGQAAAEAGIISNIMVIIVAITAIANFVSPTYSFANASRLLRFLLIITAAFLGLYGVLIVLVLMVAHLSSLRSFGVPYLAPVAPFIIESQKDVFFRFPFWSMNKRPSYLKPKLEEKQTNTGSSSPPPMRGGEGQ